MNPCCRISFGAGLWLLALSLWALAPGPALASSMGGVLGKALAEGRLTAEEASAIEAKVEEARNQGLPIGPFNAKVDEGLAKRVPGRAILNALEVMRDDYLFARNILARDGIAPSPEDTVMAGDSLRLGLSRRELAEMANLKPHAESAMLATAARTWAYLNGVSFPSALSAEILRHGLAAGTLTPGWTQLFRVVQRARDAGRPDAVVAEAATRTLVEGGGPGDLLQELGFTGRDTRQAPGGSAN
jgi:hypothetical protein